MRLSAFAPDDKANKKEFAMGADANGPREFGISFLDAEGALIQTVLLSADTVTGATDLASEIATELSATYFFITAAAYSSTEVTALASLSIVKLLAPLSRFLFFDVTPLWLGAFSHPRESHE